MKLIKDTAFYKKGTKAVVIDTCGNSKDMEIRYIGEKYEGRDADVMPKALFERIEV